MNKDIAKQVEAMQHGVADKLCLIDLFINDLKQFILPQLTNF
jgi:hypothetical protein